MTESDLTPRETSENVHPGLRTAFGVGALVLTAILLAVGAFGGDDDDAGYYLIALAFAAVATAVVFWLVLPRIRNLAVGALVLAVLGAVAIVVFWLGLPIPIAAGAAVLALEARRGHSVGTTQAAIALVLAALTVAAAILLAFVG